MQREDYKDCTFRNTTASVRMNPKRVRNGGKTENSFPQRVTDRDRRKLDKLVRRASYDPGSFQEVADRHHGQHLHLTSHVII